MEKRILILEDSLTCQVIAKESLKSLGPVELAGSCQEADRKLQDQIFDLILIDMILPDGNGFEYYGALIKGPLHLSTPVIFVTSDENISTKVAAFSVGASDYVTKPYSPLELRARAERILKSQHPEGLHRDPESGLILNLDAYKVTCEQADGRKDLSLTPHEFKILHFLLKSPERIYSRNQIIDKVWGLGTFISERTVDTHISSLRKKLGAIGNHLVSVRGEGYSWRPDHVLQVDRRLKK